MNSLFELVLWGAPAVLLSWGLLLALACGLVFRNDRSPEETSAFWNVGSEGVSRLDIG